MTDVADSPQNSAAVPSTGAKASSESSLKSVPDTTTVDSLEGNPNANTEDIAAASFGDNRSSSTDLPVVNSPDSTSTGTNAAAANSPNITSTDTTAAAANSSDSLNSLTEHSTNALQTQPTEQPHVHVQPASDNSSSPAEPQPQPPGMGMRRTSTTSSSKLHDAIQDIISQFDPLKISASTSQLPDATAAAQAAEEERRAAELRAKFEPETDGFSYNEFLAQLRNPSAKPVARTVKSFLTEFGRRPMTLAEQVRFVHDFLEFIGGKMRECAEWQAMDEREFDNAREGMEKLVMNRLYNVCFSPTTSDDSDKDHVLREKMSLFRWIREEHLDVEPSPQNAAFLQFAKSELLKMNNFKSPRDKAICVLNCCTVIYALLRNAQGADDIGADRFLPLLIYVVITANPPRLVSNIQYIMRFRSAERMQGEAGYYVTNLQGAVAFIETMDASCLSISQEEFDKSIEMTIWEIDIEKRAADRQQLPRRDPGAERAQWLIDRSSDLAKSTLEKTNNFVGRLISEFSTPGSESGSGAGEPGRSQPQPQPRQHQQQHPEHQQQRQNQRQQQQPQNQHQQAQETEGAEAVGLADWNSTLALVHDMFPNIDSDVVELVFESSRGVVSRTIEQLLEMSMGNEAEQVAREHEDSPDGAKSSSADVLQQAASVGGEDDVDEMERWKGHWADDDDSSDYTPDVDNEPLAVDSESGPAGVQDEPDQSPKETSKNQDKDLTLENASDHNQNEEQDQVVPDTSRDAELARKLQHEFEQHVLEQQ
ncbi:hypothetical protein GGH12_003045 [Coemansia sp. RSA 1822]|nr:hypothetical protein GGF49_002828 [Coemansia sp. RSA 1853]KAJ2562727.1 hypothetical protein GGH12_003045 [Coemansia sp. RSA 1822]